MEGLSRRYTQGFEGYFVYEKRARNQSLGSLPGEGVQMMGRTIFRSVRSGYPKPKYQGFKGWFAVISPSGITRYVLLKGPRRKS